MRPTKTPESFVCIEVGRPWDVPAVATPRTQAAPSLLSPKGVVGGPTTPATSVGPEPREANTSFTPPSFVAPFCRSQDNLQGVTSSLVPDSSMPAQSFAPVPDSAAPNITEAW